MKLVDKYLKIGQEVHKYFGYVESWVVIPLDHNPGMYWQIIGDEKNGSVRFAPTVDGLEDTQDAQYCEHEIFTYVGIPKYVYRGKDYTMICVDTHIDGNKFLSIFDNDKEVGGAHE